MQAASVTISVLALLFTVVTFWWLWARRGPVVSFAVTAYAAAYANDTFRIRLPVVLANRGAAMRVVVDARLRVEGQHGRSLLKWGLTRKTLQPGSDDVEDFPTPQTIAGRSAIRIHMEFRGDLLEHLPEPVDYKFTIELLLDDSTAWQAAGVGVLRFGHMVNPDHYITYDNAAEPCSPDEPIEAREALLALARRQNLNLPWR